MDILISNSCGSPIYQQIYDQGGYIYTAAGKGCFVSQKSSGMVYEEHLKKIEEHMGEIARLAGSSGITEGQLIEMYRVLQEENR